MKMKMMTMMMMTIGNIMVCRINPNGQNSNGLNPKWCVGILSGSSWQSSSSFIPISHSFFLNLFSISFPTCLTFSPKFANFFLIFLHFLKLLYNFLYNFFVQLYPTCFQLAKLVSSSILVIFFSWLFSNLFLTFLRCFWIFTNFPRFQCFAFFVELFPTFCLQNYPWPHYVLTLFAMFNTER